MILQDFLVARKVYPHIEARCFGFELEAVNSDSFDFAARFNERRCGGDSPSNLLDQFRVRPATREVLLYDAPTGTFNPTALRVKSSYGQ